MLFREYNRITVVPSPFHPEDTLEIRHWPRRDSRGKTGADMHFLRDVSEQIRLRVGYEHSNRLLQEQSIQIQLLRTSLQEQAVRDPVTNLNNHCYFVETLSC